MPEEDEITDNILRIIDEIAPNPGDELDMENTLVEDLGFDRDTLRNLAFTINKDEYFKPLGVGLIPDDVTDCVTVSELVELVQNEFKTEMPVRRRRPPPPRKS